MFDYPKYQFCKIYHGPHVVNPKSCMSISQYAGHGQVIGSWCDFTSPVQRGGGGRVNQFRHWEDLLHEGTTKYTLHHQHVFSTLILMKACCRILWHVARDDKDGKKKSCQRWQKNTTLACNFPSTSSLLKPNSQFWKEMTTEKPHYLMN